MATDICTLLARLTALLRAADPLGAFDDAVRVLGEELQIHAARGDVPDDGCTWFTLGTHDERITLRHPQGAAPAQELAPVVRPLLEALRERALVEATLNKERERLHMLSSASFEGIFVHVDGVLLDCNQRCLEMLRCTREWFLAPGTIQRVVAPEDLGKVLSHMRSGSEEPYTVTALRADGTRFLAEIRAKQGHLGERPIRVAAVRDVTEREQRGRLLRESEARLRALAEAMFDCFVHSVDGRIVDVGGDFEKLLGYGREQLIGHLIFEFVAPAARSQVRRMVDAQSTEPYETQIVRSDGTVIPVEITGTAATYQGQPARFAGLRDRSAAKRIERERQQLQARVERGQRMEALGVLAGGIAHDFNNLLLGIMGHAEVLEITLGDVGNAQPSIEAIKVAAERAAELTRQLLAYAGRGGATRWEPLDLTSAVQELQALLSPRMPAGAELHLELEDECIVRGDPTALRQVLLNLLTNATDALHGATGRVDVRVEHETDPGVDWEDALGARVGPGRWVRVEVRDTGVGMDAHAQSHIFEPFYTTKAQGHGLGLAACLGILQTHGGAIRVQSEPGKGTCFSILLPASGGDAVAEDAVTRPVAVTPCSVLVIDDEAVVRDQLMRLLSLRGFTVHGAADGEEGLRAYAELKPELVILDVAMPGMDGIEVARRLRAAGSQVPILISSGYLEQGAATELDDRLVQGTLAKPYSLTDLLKTIAAARGTVDASHPPLH